MVINCLAEKFEGASKMDNRISTLYSMVSDYAEQLSGFDAGLTTQVTFHSTSGEVLECERRRG